ncbi:hypothetical protein [Acinetobacter baumannii]|uniref:hypothetical protein n=1 Tax=Acinetobacter baumannii TaxID=470 RepID=UPI0022EAE3A9|nr:hypothetical protein [Acinetobacter baumannii]MDA3538954.1 hypothetical protein [Acinetobacter baumannii]MDA3546767.1 hypothetical protein [Acinetobacter baumannii]
MKPEHFIRDFGEKKAREVVEGIPSKYMECYYSTLCYCTKAKKYSDRFNPRIELVNMADLKRLVESVDRVNEHGGYLAAKELLSFLIVHQGAFGKSAVSDETINSLKAAIKDHESIYGGGDD